MAKIILSCAITGSIHTPSMSPHLPITPDQIADQSIPHQTDWERQEIRRAYPVEDNYLLIRYTIPSEDLSSALYMLKIRIREPGTRRETERSIQFQLVPRSTIDQG